MRIPRSLALLLALQLGADVVHAAGPLVSEVLGGATAMFLYYDPLSPNWEIEITRIEVDRIRIELRMKRLVSGGQGEVRQVFLRNVRRLMQEGGYAAYDITQWEEGIESSRPFARRVAVGEVKFTQGRASPGY